MAIVDERIPCDQRVRLLHFAETGFVFLSAFVLRFFPRILCLLPGRVAVCFHPKFDQVGGQVFTAVGLGQGVEVGWLLGGGAPYCAARRGSFKSTS